MLYPHKHELRQARRMFYPHKYEIRLQFSRRKRGSANTSIAMEIPRTRHWKGMSARPLPCFISGTDQRISMESRIRGPIQLPIYVELSLYNCFQTNGYSYATCYEDLKPC